TIHLPAIRQLDGIDLCAACDTDADACRRHARRLRCPVLDDPVRLLETERPDWVVIAAPPAHHRDLCLLALEHDAHVFCEKPFVESLEQVDEVIAAAERANRVVAVNHEYPSMPIFAAALAQVGTTSFGRPLFFQAWQHVHELPAGQQGWRSTGHTMREFGSHVVDLAMHFFGGPPETVFAHMPRPVDCGDADPIDIIVLDFPGGRAASIVLDRICRGRHRYLEMRVDGERASVHASIGGRARFSVFVDPKRKLPGVRLELAGGGQVVLEEGEKVRTLARNPVRAFAIATGRHFRAVLDSLANGEEPPAGVHRARQVVAVVDAAYRSARTGERVRV
ncbi:MAG: Gfo/Idh/MocA family protein, partial [Planctomycetota bacterium]